jgi:amino acid adenylation domain-containing protein
VSTPFLLPQLVSEAASRAPDAPAVRHGGDELTYRELDEASDAVALALIEGGVRRRDRVVLHAPKSVAAVSAVYGIMKAGAAYVPIEPSSPGPRLADIVAQCRPAAVVTWSGAREKLSAERCSAAGTSFVLALDDAAAFADLPVGVVSFDDARAASAGPIGQSGAVDRDLAYVLFTSGSTGKPKGVMLSHRNALTFVSWVVDTFGLGPDDRLSNHAPFNFDLSVLDLYGAAAAGACVTLVPEGMAMFPTRLADLIERERISVWYSVPSVLTLLVTRGSIAARELDALRWVLFAGEVFPVKYLRETMAAVPRARFANLYGPTETNVVTWYEVPSLDRGRTAPIPIGKACANTDCIAVGEDGGQIEEPGREGLLYVRGSTVMEGYFGRPDETAAAFSPDPFDAGGDARLYCTGDWVTLDDDGNYLFLGRRDHMVKTGGYRVELGEIETALYSHPAVRDAVAVAVPDEILGNRIRAYVVADDVSEQELKAHCSTVVPRYMVPEGIEFLESLPRTATDKVDRPRLAAAASSPAGGAGAR